jgi:hypothetical protein
MDGPSCGGSSGVVSGGSGLVSKQELETRRGRRGLAAASRIDKPRRSFGRCCMHCQFLIGRILLSIVFVSLLAAKGSPSTRESW